MQLCYAVDKKKNASFSSYIYMVHKSFETNFIYDHKLRVEIYEINSYLFCIMIITGLQIREGNGKVLSLLLEQNSIYDINLCWLPMH